jgi:hypothetical protein
MDVTSAVKSNWEAVERALPQDYEALARALGVIREQPPQLHTKIHDAQTLLRLLLLHAALGFSLRLTASTARVAGLAQVSWVAIHKRMCTSGPYLAALVARLLGLPTRVRRIGGYRLRIADSTSVSRPGDKGTTARIHYLLGLPDLGLGDLQVTDAHTGESFRLFRFHKGELVLGDRGLARPPGLLHVKAAGAEVLVRVHKESLPLFDRHGQPLDLKAKLRSVEERKRAMAFAAYVHARDEQTGEVVSLRGRLCIKRLSPKKASAARAALKQKRRKKQRRAPSRLELKCAGYLLLFTTAPRKRLPLGLVFKLYRLRWQVELRIKRDKSLGGLDELPNRLPETIYSWLMLKLLVQLLAERMASAATAFPPRAEGLGETPLGYDQAAHGGAPGGATAHGAA